MHENEISERIIGAAIEVHRHHGPGLVEQIYEESLCHELHLCVEGWRFSRGERPSPTGTRFVQSLNFMANSNAAARKAPVLERNYRISSLRFSAVFASLRPVYRN